MKILYKSIPDNQTSNGHKWTKGKWYKIKDDLDICHKGFHASKNIIDAMTYVNCGWIAKVEVRGKSIIENNKECWSEMKIVEWYKWTKKDSVSLAIFAAELVLGNYEKEYPKDMRPREAIEAAKQVLKLDNETNRSAAESAAESATKSAMESTVWPTESAAKFASWSAAKSAESAEFAAEFAAKSAEFAAKFARSAAWSAAWSAELAAGSAAKQNTLDKCHQFVIDRKFKED